MFLESETDLIIALALAAGVLLILAIVAGVMAMLKTFQLRQIEERLIASERQTEHLERRMFNVLNAIPVALVETDTHGKFTFANRTAHQLLGRRDAELLGLRFHSATWGICYPDGRVIPQELLPIARALRGQVVKGFQHLIAHPGTRSKMLVSVTAMPVMNPAGEVIGSTTALVELENLAGDEGQGVDAAWRGSWFDSAGLALWGLAGDGVVRTLNPAAQTLLGFSRDQLVTRPFVDALVAPEDRQRTRTYFDSVLKDPLSAPATLEVTLEPEAQPRRRVLLAAWKVEGHQAEVGLTIQVTDIEAVRLREMQRDADFATALADATRARAFGGAGIWRYDPATQTLHEDEPLRTLIGRPAVGANSLVPAEDQAALDTAIRAVLNGGTTRVDTLTRVITPEGEMRWIAWRGAAQRDAEGQMTAVIGAAYEVTGIKQTEIAAREATKALESLAAQLPALTRTWDVDGLMTSVNDRWTELTQLSREALVREDLRPALDPDQRQAVRTAFDTAFARRATQALTYRVQTKDGGMIPVVEMIAPRFETDGRFSGYVGVALQADSLSQTLEAAHAAALALSQKETEGLQSKLNEVEAELVALRQQADQVAYLLDESQKLETVGRLTGEVASDFSQMLSVIIGALDMIQKQSDRPEQVRRLSEAALVAGRRGERLTRQLQAVSEQNG